MWCLRTRFAVLLGLPGRASVRVRRCASASTPTAGAARNSANRVIATTHLLAYGEGSSLRQYGHSKDHRKDLPQIVIGLAVTREGIPVRCWTWPAGTNDQTVITEVKDGLRDWWLGRVVTVCDTGFSSEANQAYLRRAGGHYITGIKMREGPKLADQALARQGRYQEVRGNLRVKEVRLDGDDGRRFIICHNPAEAMRDTARREDQLTAVREELVRIKAACEADAKKAKVKAAKTGKRPAAPSDAPHRKAECALRDHPALGRWLKQPPTTGRLSIDAAKVAAEARLDGKYLLATSDPDLSAEDIALRTCWRPSAPSAR